ncbi:MAG: VOC family protein [Terriglobia bacterium]
MWGKAKPIPDGFHTITPSLVVKDAARAMDFYKAAFGAEIKSVHRTQDGKVIHAELLIGNSIVMLNDEFPGASSNPPQPGSSASVTLHIYLESADETFNRAVTAGATALMPMADAFWGDRYGQIKDPFGYVWSVAVHKEDLSSKEIEKRAKEAFAKMPQAHAQAK